MKTAESPFRGISPRKVASFIAALFCFCFHFSSFSQKSFTESEADTLQLANALFDAKRYILALPIYEKLLEKQPAHTFLKYKIGVCLLYKKDSYDKALENLLYTLEKNKKAADIVFYTGRAYMLNYKFDQAMEQFSAYKGKGNPEFKKLALEYIENCKNGKVLVADPKTVNIQNLGSIINTNFAEYVPVISSDESILIFTYRGAKSKGTPPGIAGSPEAELYYEDVFMSEKADGKWKQPVGLDSINTYDHDAAIALSNDGQQLFIYRNTSSDMGDIYMSHLRGSNWSQPQRLQGQVNSGHWEGSCSLSPDGKTLYFSSERPGGFGGRDLYAAILQADGSWGNVKNLGAQINTAKDEDAPFIHPDGRSFFYSSTGLNSMGGYDIFKTEVLSDTSWAKPENAGFPINTIDDDIYYVLSANGERGYYSSGKQGGQGNQDIYIVEPAIGNGKYPRLVMLFGSILLNEKPVEAQIDVFRANNTPYGSFHSNSANGKYLINLPAGSDFNVIYKVKGYDNKEFKVNTMTLDTFIEQNVNIEFFNKFTLTLIDTTTGLTMGTAEQTGYRSFRFTQLPTDKPLMFKLEGDDSDRITEIIIPINGLEVKLVRNGDRIFRYTPLKTEETSLTAMAENDTRLNPNDAFESIVMKHGKEIHEGVFYTVQIAAYRNSKNYTYQKLEFLGTVKELKTEDDVTRFILGKTPTLSECHNLLLKVKKAGQQDAFVVALVNGKRVLLRELDFLR